MCHAACALPVSAALEDLFEVGACFYSFHVCCFDLFRFAWCCGLFGGGCLVTPPARGRWRAPRESWLPHAALSPRPARYPRRPRSRRAPATGRVRRGRSARPPLAEPCCRAPRRPAATALGSRRGERQAARGSSLPRDARLGSRAPVRPLPLPLAPAPAHFSLPKLLKLLPLPLSSQRVCQARARAQDPPAADGPHPQQHARDVWQGRGAAQDPGAAARDILRGGLKLCVRVC